MHGKVAVTARSDAVHAGERGYDTRAAEALI